MNQRHRPIIFLSASHSPPPKIPPKTQKRKANIPHLTLHKSQSLKYTIMSLPKRNLMRSPRIITPPINEIIPHLTITIEGPVSMTTETDVPSAEDPGGGLVLVAHREGVVEEVGDVCSPLFLGFVRRWRERRGAEELRVVFREGRLRRLRGRMCSLLCGRCMSRLGR